MVEGARYNKLVLYLREDMPACPRPLTPKIFTSVVGPWSFMVFSHSVAGRCLTKTVEYMTFPSFSRPVSMISSWYHQGQLAWYHQYQMDFVICNLKMIKVPRGLYYVIKWEKLRDQDQDNKGILLPLSCKCKLLLILSIRVLRINNLSVGAYIPSARGCVHLLQWWYHIQIIDATESTNCFTEVHYHLLRSIRFCWDQPGELNA